VDVRGGHESVRLDDGLDHDRVAVGVRRGGEEGDALAGARFSMVSPVRIISTS
jgi:hypothetical protein